VAAANRYGAAPPSARVTGLNCPAARTRRAHAVAVYDGTLNVDVPHANDADRDVQHATSSREKRYRVGYWRVPAVAGGRWWEWWQAEQRGESAPYAGNGGWQAGRLGKATFTTTAASTTQPVMRSARTFADDGSGVMSGEPRYTETRRVYVVSCMRRRQRTRRRRLKCREAVEEVVC